MTVRLQPRPIGDTWRFFMREMSGDVGVDLSVYSDISCQIRIASTRALFATPTIILADQTSALTRGSYELRVDAATTETAAKGLYVFDVQATDSLGIVTTLHVPPLEFEAVVDVTKLAADPPVSPPPTFTGDGTRLLMRSPLGVYTSIRIEPAGTAAPTVTDDAAHGYAAGSWWLYAGDMWRCRDATTGAAVWVTDVVASDSLPLAVARASTAGTGADFARADHVHDGGVRVIRATITSAATLAAGDETCRVNTSSGAIILTLPDPAIAGEPGKGRDFLIKKINADANGITLRPHVTTGSGPTVEGGAAGADLLLDGSDAAERGAWYVFSDGAAWWVG